MAQRNNEFGLKVELNEKDATVVVTVRKKGEKGFTDVAQKAYPAASIHAELRGKCGLYGLSKLLQDRTSEVDAGPDKLAAMDAVMAQLTEGKWEKDRVVGAPTVSAEVEALAQFKKITIPDAQRALRGYTAEQREKILGHPEIVKRAEAIRLKRDSAPQADLGDLLG